MNPLKSPAAENPDSHTDSGTNGSASHDTDTRSGTQHSGQSQPVKKKRPTSAHAQDGTLPAAVAVVLFVLASGTVVGLARQMGVEMSAIGLALAAGVIAGGGVRIAISNQDRGIWIAIAVCVLWAGSLTFVGGLAVGLSQSVIGFQPLASAFTAISVAFLVPYGIVGGATQRFGRGAATYALRRYAIGTGVLSVMVVFLALASQFNTGVDTAVTVLSQVRVPTGVPLDNEIVRMWVNCGLMIASVIASRQIISRIPLEVFVGVDGVSTVTTVRRSTRKAGTYILLALLIAPFVGTVLSEADLPVTYLPVDRLAELILGLSAGVFTTTFASVVGVVSGTIVVVKLLKTITNINPRAVVEYVIPPLIVATGGYLVVSTFSEQIAELTTDSTTELIPGLTVQRLVQSIQSPYAGNPELPIVLTLALVVVALIVSAVVLLLPSLLVTGMSSGRRGSLVGVASAASGLAVLVITAAATGAGTGLVIGGVVGAVVVWEFGEYSLVAAGELTAKMNQTRGQVTSAAGIGKLLTVHGVIVGLISCLGGAAAGGALMAASVIVVPQAVAILTVALTAIGLAGVLQALSG